MDNLGAHRPKRIRELIEGQGCELIYLPAYSPDYDPIEEAFSKIKMRCIQESTSQSRGQEQRGFSWTLAITLRSRRHRLASLRTPAGLLPYRSLATTRKKSPPVPTTPYAPVPKHRRRLDVSCRTTSNGGW